MALDVASMDMTNLLGMLAGVVCVLSAFIWYVYQKENDPTLKESPPNDNSSAAEDEGDNAEHDVYKRLQGKKSKRNVDHKKSQFEHDWLLTTLKGHTSQVSDICFAPDGKRFASVSCDRTVFLWKVSDFECKEHKSTRQVLESDTAMKVAFAPDSKSIVFAMKRDNKLCVYKLMKKEDNISGVKIVRVETVDFPNCHIQDICYMGISALGKFLFSASHDAKVSLYDIKGNVLKKLDPKVSTLYNATLSPDGRFLAVTGFTSDAFVYEPQFNRDGGFLDCKKVFSLSGHQSGVLALQFNQDSKLAVTVSKDGYWRLFNTDIRYEAGQDADVIRRGYWSSLKGAAPDSVRMTLSPSGGSIAVSCGSTIKMFSSEDETADFMESRSEEVVDNLAKGPQCAAKSDHASLRDRLRDAATRMTAWEGDENQPKPRMVAVSEYAAMYRLNVLVQMSGSLLQQIDKASKWTEKHMKLLNKHSKKLKVFPLVETMFEATCALGPIFNLQSIKREGCKASLRDHLRATDKDEYESDANAGLTIDKPQTYIPPLESKINHFRCVVHLIATSLLQLIQMYLLVIPQEQIDLRPRELNEIISRLPPSYLRAEDLKLGAYNDELLKNPPPNKRSYPLAPRPDASHRQSVRSLSRKNSRRSERSRKSTGKERFAGSERGARRMKFVNPMDDNKSKEEAKSVKSAKSARSKKDKPESRKEATKSVKKVSKSAKSSKKNVKASSKEKPVDAPPAEAKTPEGSEKLKKGE